MAQSVPFSVVKDFLENGKGREQGLFVPPDADTDTVVTALETGLSGKHIADDGIGAAQIATGAFRLLVFTGANVSSTPVDATLTGAEVGDTVIGIINLSDLTTGNGEFAGTIATVDKISQTEVANYSAKKFAVLLLAKGG
jgi:hypothetical protein